MCSGIVGYNPSIKYYAPSTNLLVVAHSPIGIFDLSPQSKIGTHSMPISFKNNLYITFILKYNEHQN